MSNLVVRVDDPYGLKHDVQPIKFGAYVQVSFAGATLQNIYRLPQSLVNNQTVWIVNDENKLEPRKVTVVREEGEYFYISDGLEVNDQLVLTLPEYPQEGMEVKVAGMKEMTSDAETAAVEKL